MTRPEPPLYSDSDPDLDLVQFLRAHRPLPPPMAEGLEAELMQEIEVLSGAKQQGQLPLAWAPQKRRRRWRWVVPPAIAAAALAAWVVGQVQRPAAYSVAELAEIEAFVEQSWATSVYGAEAVSILPAPVEDWMVSSQ